ncbi:MAG: hypothetical protein ACTS47_01225 [Candidatus Hodgkinia cicadicola]
MRASADLCSKRESTAGRTTFPFITVRSWKFRVSYREVAYSNRGRFQRETLLTKTSETKLSSPLASNGEIDTNNSLPSAVVAFSLPSHCGSTRRGRGEFGCAVGGNKEHERGRSWLLYETETFVPRRRRRAQFTCLRSRRNGK